uniref:Uncharacterized protein n=1 Tax=Candidatus Kentrum sp. LFY TaxID=2126342 RepID=A0A450WRT0_9GAMM|nr:MAG: Protein of unknown function (DUF2796) [Candidatus Kentron sp. LFY]
MMAIITKAIMKHGHESGHETGHESEHGHEHEHIAHGKKGHETHADISVSYRYHCQQPGRLDGIETQGLFQYFPGFEKKNRRPGGPEIGGNRQQRLHRKISVSIWKACSPARRRDPRIDANAPKTVRAHSRIGPFHKKVDG